MTNKNQTIIISHMEDLDGLVSAALIKQYLIHQECDPSSINVQLTTYPKLPFLLHSYSQSMREKNLYILDLGINREVLAEIINFSATIPDQTEYFRCYIDHHQIPTSFVRSGDLNSSPTASITDILTQRFDLFINPSKTSSKRSRQCTAELIYDQFSSLQSPFWDQLVQFAHMTDFPKENFGLESPTAHQLNRYVTFYQHDVNRLYALLDCMIDPSSWAQFLKEMSVEMTRIDEWYANQYVLIQRSTTQFTLGDKMFIAAWADLRSGEITSDLQSLYPGTDFILGLSVREKYLNIRTPHKQASRIAAVYGGGGHEDRAGFKLPSHWEKYITQYSEDLAFPMTLLKEFGEACRTIKQKN